MASVVTFRADDVALIASPASEIDLTNTDAIRDAILARVDTDTAKIVLDLSTTSYLDSAGVRMVFELARAVEQRGLAFCTVRPESSTLRRVFEIVGLAEVVPVAETLEAARLEGGPASR